MAFLWISQGTSQAGSHVLFSPKIQSESVFWINRKNVSGDRENCAFGWMSGADDLFQFRALGQDFSVEIQTVAWGASSASSVNKEEVDFSQTLRPTHMDVWVGYLLPEAGRINVRFDHRRVWPSGLGLKDHDALRGRPELAEMVEDFRNETADGAELAFVTISPVEIRDNKETYGLCFDFFPSKRIRTGLVHERVPSPARSDFDENVSAILHAHGQVNQPAWDIIQFWFERDEPVLAHLEDNLHVIQIRRQASFIGEPPLSEAQPPLESPDFLPRLPAYEVYSHCLRVQQATSKRIIFQIQGIKAARGDLFLIHDHGGVLFFDKNFFSPDQMTGYSTVTFAGRDFVVLQHQGNSFRHLTSRDEFVEPGLGNRIDFYIRDYLRHYQVDSKGLFAEVVLNDLNRILNPDRALAQDIAWISNALWRDSASSTGGLILLQFAIVLRLQALRPDDRNRLVSILKGSGASAVAGALLSPSVQALLASHRKGHAGTGLPHASDLAFDKGQGRLIEIFLKSVGIPDLSSGASGPVWDVESQIALGLLLISGDNRLQQVNGMVEWGLSLKPQQVADEDALSIIDFYLRLLSEGSSLLQEWLFLVARLREKDLASAAAGTEQAELKGLLEDKTRPAKALIPVDILGNGKVTGHFFGHFQPVLQPLIVLVGELPAITSGWPVKGLADGIKSFGGADKIEAEITKALNDLELKSTGDPDMKRKCADLKRSLGEVTGEKECVFYFVLHDLNRYNEKQAGLTQTLKDLENEAPFLYKTITDETTGKPLRDILDLRFEDVQAIVPPRATSNISVEDQYQIPEDEDAINDYFNLENMTAKIKAQLPSASAHSDDALLEAMRRVRANVIRRVVISDDTKVPGFVERLNEEFAEWKRLTMSSRTDASTLQNKWHNLKETESIISRLLRHTEVQDNSEMDEGRLSKDLARITWLLKRLT